MPVEEFNTWLAYMNTNPSLEDRFDVYLSTLIEVIKKVNGDKEPMRIPLYDWKEMYLNSNKKLETEDDFNQFLAECTVPINK